MGAWEGMISAESGIASRCAASGTDSMAERSQLSDIDSSDSLWSLEGEKGESLFLNLEELEGRDDVKGINRAKKERERAHSSVGRERGRRERLLQGWISSSRGRKEKSCRRFPF